MYKFFTLIIMIVSSPCYAQSVSFNNSTGVSLELCNQSTKEATIVGAGNTVTIDIKDNNKLTYMLRNDLPSNSNFTSLEACSSSGYNQSILISSIVPDVLFKIYDISSYSIINSKNSGDTNFSMTPMDAAEIGGNVQVTNKGIISNTVKKYQRNFTNGVIYGNTNNEVTYDEKTGTMRYNDENVNVSLTCPTVLAGTSIHRCEVISSQAINYVRFNTIGARVLLYDAKLDGIKSDGDYAGGSAGYASIEFKPPQKDIHNKIVNVYRSKKDLYIEAKDNRAYVDLHFDEGPAVAIISAKVKIENRTIELSVPVVIIQGYVSQILMNYSMESGYGGLPGIVTNNITFGIDSLYGLLYENYLPALNQVSKVYIQPSVALKGPKIFNTFPGTDSIFITQVQTLNEDIESLSYINSDTKPNRTINFSAKRVKNYFDLDLRDNLKTASNYLIDAMGNDFMYFESYINDTESICNTLNGHGIFYNNSDAIIYRLPDSKSVKCEQAAISPVGFNLKSVDYERTESTMEMMDVPGTSLLYDTQNNSFRNSRMAGLLFPNKDQYFPDDGMKSNRISSLIKQLDFNLNIIVNIANNIKLVEDDPMGRYTKIGFIPWSQKYNIINNNETGYYTGVTMIPLNPTKIPIAYINNGAGIDYIPPLYKNKVGSFTIFKQEANGGYYFDNALYSCTVNNQPCTTKR